MTGIFGKGGGYNVTNRYKTCIEILSTLMFPFNSRTHLYGHITIAKSRRTTQDCLSFKTDHSRTRVFPVTWQRWRSQHSISHTRKPRDARKLHGSIFTEPPELLPVKFNITGILNFTFFLLLWPLFLPTGMTFVCRLDPHLLKLYPQTKNKLSTSRLLKVIVLHTYRQTDRQTDRCHWSIATLLDGW